jgi:Thermophilic metalloprotease (M29)
MYVLSLPAIADAPPLPGAATQRRCALTTAVRRAARVKPVEAAATHSLLRREDRRTAHLALGRSYPETGGKNGSALHWDLICDLRDGGRITADGVPVQQDGHFTL